MRYYIADESQTNGFLEVSEAEYNALFGDESIRFYVQAVYRGDIVIDKVPAEHQEAVQIVVANKVKRWGLHTTDEAVDLADAPYVYEETDTKIEVDAPEETEYGEKLKNE